MNWRIGISVLFLFTALHGGAQPFFRQTLDTTRMLIGDRLTLTQQSSGMPPGQEPDDALKKQQWLEITDPGAWTLTPQKVYERKIRFSVFDSGVYVIPAMELVIDSVGVTTPPLYLRVDLPPDTTAGLLPIKDIIATNETGHRWLFIGLMAVLVLLILGLLYFLFRADRARPGKLEYARPARPHEVALQRLEELDGRKLWQSGRIKEYYDEWLDILRHFLQDGFKLPAPESTTAEIVRSMDALGVPWQKRDELAAWLRKADLIRFANKETAAADHIDALAAARSFVSANKDNALSFLEEHRLDYRTLLGEAMSSQFEQPGRTVPDELVQLAGNKSTAELILYSGLSRARRFTLPEQWVALHRDRRGQIGSWQANLLEAYPGWSGTLLLVVLVPVIAAFVPVLAVAGWIRKENIFSRGVFALGETGRLFVDERKLAS